MMSARADRPARRYEVITDGATPYGELDNGQVMVHVCTGRAPGVPEAADPGQAKLLSKCWAVAPGDRPTFEEIAEVAQRGWQANDNEAEGAADTAIAAIAAAYAIPRSGAVASPRRDSGGYAAPRSAGRTPANDARVGVKLEPKRDADGYATPLSSAPEVASEPNRDADGYAAPKR